MKKASVWMVIVFIEILLMYSIIRVENVLDVEGISTSTEILKKVECRTGRKFQRIYSFHLLGGRFEEYSSRHIRCEDSSVLSELVGKEIHFYTKGNYTLQITADDLDLLPFKVAKKNYNSIWYIIGVLIPTLYIFTPILRRMPLRRREKSNVGDTNS